MCFTGSQIKPALKGEVGFALAKAGGVEKESRFAWYRQPLSQTFGLPAPRPGRLLVQHSFIYEHGDGFPSPHLHNLLRSPAAGRISHGAAIFHIAQAVIIRRTGDIQLIPNVN